MTVFKLSMGELKPYLVVLVTSYISGLQTLPVLNNDYLTDSNLTGYPLHNPVLYLDEIVFPARQSTAKEKKCWSSFCPRHKAYDLQLY